MPKRRSQSDHDTMVKNAASFLIGKKYRDVKADIQGFTQPVTITWKNTGQGHIPDVTAQGDKFNLFEMETADSIDDQHTDDQWKLFAAYAQQQTAVFWVVVPNGSEAIAKRRLDALGIHAEVWSV